MNTLVWNFWVCFWMRFKFGPTCVSASVLLISKLKISLAAIMAKGVSSPNAFAIPIAMAVLPRQQTGGGGVAGGGVGGWVGGWVRGRDGQATRHIAKGGEGVDHTRWGRVTRNAGCHHGKACLLSQLLGHTHGNGSLACTLTTAQQQPSAAGQHNLNSAARAESAAVQ